MPQPDITEMLRIGESPLFHAAADEIEKVRAERDALMNATWDAYVLTGSDPDGCDRWHCTPEQAGRSLIHAVQELRDDYQEDNA